jgi:hypothetical protein
MLQSFLPLKVQAPFSELFQISLTVKELLSVTLLVCMKSEQQAVVQATIDNVHKGLVEHQEASMRQYKVILDNLLEFKRLRDSKGV